MASERSELCGICMEGICLGGLFDENFCVPFRYAWRFAPSISLRGHHGLRCFCISAEVGDAQWRWLLSGEEYAVLAILLLIAGLDRVRRLETQWDDLGYDNSLTLHVFHGST